MTKFLGIDYGLERTGLAVSDPNGELVFPLLSLKFKNYKKRSDFFDALANVIRTENVEAIVWGWPSARDGQENLICAQVRNAAKRLFRRVELPYCFMPEFLSSFEAEDDLRKIGLKGEKLKEALDQQAAFRILSSYLAQDKNKREIP